MTECKISDFFTPKRSVKRRRSRSSPASPCDNQVNLGLDTMGDEEKVGELTKGELRGALRDVMSELLDTKLSTLATKSDLLNLSSQVSELQLENDAKREEIKELKNQNKFIMDKLLDLESRSRRNNLIFRGLKCGPRTSDFKQLVGSCCSEMFGNNQICINRAHPLGKEKDTIIAHLPYDADIDYIMRRVSDLKGTGYAVYRDFPREIRVKRACLTAVRNEVERVTGRRRMPLVHDHLTIDKCKFTWEDGKLMAGRQCGVDRLKTMFGHDFSTFVNGLKDPPPRRARENVNETNQLQTSASEGRELDEDESSRSQISREVDVDKGGGGNGGAETNSRRGPGKATTTAGPGKATTVGSANYSAALQG